MKYTQGKYIITEKKAKRNIFPQIWSHLPVSFWLFVQQSRTERFVRQPFSMAAGSPR